MKNSRFASAESLTNHYVMYIHHAMSFVGGGGGGLL